MAKSIGEITVQIDGFINKLNQDLQISTPSGLFDPSPFQKAATALSGFVFIFNTPFSEFVANALDREQLVTEIAVLANLTMDEVIDFYQDHSYSLEFIRAAIQAGAKLDEEDIKRTMEERASYGYKFDQTPKHWRNLEEIIGKQLSTFAVTLPNGDRREVKAHYMEVDGATLYFENEDHEIILAFGPGHWVWAERVEEDE